MDKYLLQKNNSKLLKDKKYIDEVLASGSVLAEKIARKKVEDIKQKIGF